MATLTEKSRRGEHIISDLPHISRETMTLKSGVGVIAPGTVLADDGAGKLIIPVPAASDGTENPVAIAYDHADATSADVEIVVSKRITAVNDELLVWPTMNTAQEAAAKAALADLNIIVH